MYPLGSCNAMFLLSDSPGQPTLCHRSPPHWLQGSLTVTQLYGFHISSAGGMAWSISWSFSEPQFCLPYNGVLTLPALGQGILRQDAWHAEVKGWPPEAQGTLVRYAQQAGMGNRLEKVNLLLEAERRAPNFPVSWSQGKTPTPVNSFLLCKLRIPVPTSQVTQTKRPHLLPRWVPGVKRMVPLLMGLRGG